MRSSEVIIGYAIYKYGGEVEGHYCNIFGHTIYCNLVCGTIINKSCSLAFQGSYGSICGSDTNKEAL